MERENDYRRSGSNTSEKLTYLLIGGGIGAIVALLFAPKSGVELREDIADVTRKGVEKGREAAGQIGERAGEYYEVARERAGEYYQTAEGKAKQFAEQARGAAAVPANTLSAAIEAGKKAYSEEKRKSEAASIAQGRPSYPNELGEGGDKEN